MNKYTYKKISNKSCTHDQIIIDENRYKDFLPKEKSTMVSVFNSIYQSFKSLTNSSRIASIIIPSIFIFSGFAFIYRQVFPEIQQVIQKNAGYLDQGNISPVSEDFIDLSAYVSKAENFEDITSKALNDNILLPDNQSLDFSGTFFISIPSLGINRLTVTANVDSTSENSYQPVLNRSLAHFKSTGLPISDIKNNIVIYGHSISMNYNPSRQNPMVAFSFLPELKIGDEILIEMNNQQYKFAIQRTKIVEPTDVSIITGARGRRTLTLFTCYPLGSNAQRFVAVAREIN